MNPLSLSTTSSEKPGFLSRNVMEQMEQFLHTIIWYVSLKSFSVEELLKIITLYANQELRNKSFLTITIQNELFFIWNYVYTLVWMVALQEKN